MGKKSGKGKMVPQVLIPKKAIRRYSQKVNEILAPNTTKESVKAKIIALNRLTRGWCQYYCCTSTPSRVFGPLDNRLFWKMAHWLGRKYKKEMPEIMQKWFYGPNRINLISPKEFKTKRLRTTTWHNPYTAKEAIIREQFLWYERLWIGNEDRQEAADLREEMILLKGTVCALQRPDCESNVKPLHPSEVEMDHIIPRAQFKDVREADRMSNLQPVCSSCHRAKTKTDLKVLSRMR